MLIESIETKTNHSGTHLSRVHKDLITHIPRHSSEVLSDPCFTYISTPCEYYQILSPEPAISNLIQLRDTCRNTYKPLYLTTLFILCKTISSVRDNIITIFIPAHWYRFLQLFYLLFEVLDRLNTILFYYLCCILNQRHQLSICISLFELVY